MPRKSTHPSASTREPVGTLAKKGKFGSLTTKQVKEAITRIANLPYSDQYIKGFYSKSKKKQEVDIKSILDGVLSDPNNLRGLSLDALVFVVKVAKLMIQSKLELDEIMHLVKLEKQQIVLTSIPMETVQKAIEETKLLVRKNRTQAK